MIVCHHHTSFIALLPQVIERAVDAVSYLRSLGCEDIEFTAEDASRSDPDFVCKVMEQVVSSKGGREGGGKKVGGDVSGLVGLRIEYLVCVLLVVSGVVSRCAVRQENWAGVVSVSRGASTS